MSPFAEGTSALTPRLQEHTTTTTLTHCDYDNGCNTKTVTSEAPLAATTTTGSPKTYTTATVTQCDKNGCTAQTVALKSKQTSEIRCFSKTYTTATSLMAMVVRPRLSLPKLLNKKPLLRNLSLNHAQLRLLLIVTENDGCKVSVVTSEASNEFRSQHLHLSNLQHLHRYKIAIKWLYLKLLQLSRTSAAPKSYVAGNSETVKATSLTTAVFSGHGRAISIVPNLALQFL
nr:CIC_HP1_G0005940.mRNA.1.CDS.1 [Saccharomyces cerevisiae]